jgi:hypothetical protein
MARNTVTGAGRLDARLVGISTSIGDRHPRLIRAGG